MLTVEQLYPELNKSLARLSQYQAHLDSVNEGQAFALTEKPNRNLPLIELPQEVVISTLTVLIQREAEFAADLQQKLTALNEYLLTLEGAQ